MKIKSIIVSAACACLSMGSAVAQVQKPVQVQALVTDAASGKPISNNLVFVEKIDANLIWYRKRSTDPR